MRSPVRGSMNAMTRPNPTYPDSAQWFLGPCDEDYWSCRDCALVAGLTLYGLSMSLMVRANLGLDPWDVLHQSLSARTGLPIGVVSAVVGALVLLAWRPLRLTPGIGTLANVAVVAVVVDVGLGAVEPPSSPPARAVMLLGGVMLNAAATVLYIGAGMGAGPRDGLMTGLAANTGRPVWLVRTGVEGTVLAVGWMLGGPVGIGTFVYAFGVGPLVQLVLRVMPKRVVARSGWAATVAARPALVEARPV